MHTHTLSLSYTDTDTDTHTHTISHSLAPSPTLSTYHRACAHTLAHIPNQLSVKDFQLSTSLFRQVKDLPCFPFSHSISVGNELAHLGTRLQQPC